jgi:hypothetical protein
LEGINNLEYDGNIDVHCALDIPELSIHCTGSVIFRKDTIVDTIHCKGHIVAKRSLHFCGGEITGSLEVGDYLTGIDVIYLKLPGY